jgi:crotonobetainyl-CoA:carnitine CoA-transferase CaiB-like acyl-CoA transferase
MIGVANDNLWRKFCALAELPDMAADERFCTTRGRAEHRAEVVARVQAAVELKPVAFWTEKLGAAGVPVAAIQTLQQLLEHPQTQSRGLALQYEGDSNNGLQAVPYPIIFDAQPRELGRVPPALGEHTREVLLEVGYSDEAIAAMLHEGVLRDARG